MKRMSRELRDETTKEWRALGFYYGYQDDRHRWFVRGSMSGIIRLCGMLRGYANDSRHRTLSEHEHIGPYMYLKFVTAETPRITPEGIFGRPSDFIRLAELVESTISIATAQRRFIIDSEFSQANDASIVFEIADDDFDPAGNDPNLVY